MKIYDISQELFSCVVFPGDPAPAKETVLSIENGDPCNLTTLSMCAHNGTHVDAPYHFYQDGRRIDGLELKKVIGPAQVISFDGELAGADVERLLLPDTKRVLWKGRTVVTLEAAQALNRHGIWLVGVESQTVGPEDAPRDVHLELLGREVVLLEGIRLDRVPDGSYLLNAAPVNLGGADGAPCRAVLLDLTDGTADEPKQ